MRFTIDAKEFCGACNEVAKAITNKSTMPILQGVKMSLTDNILTLSGYDLDVGIEAKIPVIGEENGEIVTCAAKMFISALNKLKGDIIFESNGEKITLISGKKTNIDLIGGNPENYPALPEQDYDNEISGDILSAALSSVDYAIDENSTKETARGAYLSVDNGKAEIVGSNGVLLAMYTANCSSKKFDCIIPKSAISAIISLANKNQTIKFGITKSQLFFGTESGRIITRIIAGDYLDYKTIFSRIDSSFTAVDINKAPLVEALELASIFISEREKAPTEFDFTANGLDIRIKSTLGKSESHVDCDCPIKLITAYNARYLLEAVKKCASETVTLYVKGELMPGMISDRVNCSAIIMPIRRK